MNTEILIGICVGFLLSCVVVHGLMKEARENFDRAVHNDRIYHLTKWE